MSKPFVEDSAMIRSAKGLSKIMAVGIVLAVAAFGDVMYIVSMSTKFPSGLLLIFCYLGAFTSFLAVAYLLLGKSIAFRPGPQLLGAWIVFVAELAIIALNILMVFDPSGGGPLASWAFISPATPVLHMLGVALLFFLDPDLRDKHANMEVQEKMDQAERDVQLLTHTARIDLRRRQIGHVSKALEEAVNSPESLAYINQFGRKLNHDLLIEMTGMSAAALSSGPAPTVPGLPAPSAIVPSTGYAVSTPPRAVTSTPPYQYPVSVAASYPPTSESASRPLTSELVSGPLGADDWLTQINDRIAAERASRLAAESVAPVAASGDAGLSERAAPPPVVLANDLEAAPPSQGPHDPEVVQRGWWEPEQAAASSVAPTEQGREQEANASDPGPSRAQYRVKRQFGKSSS